MYFRPSVFPGASARHGDLAVRSLDVDCLRLTRGGSLVKIATGVVCGLTLFLAVMANAQPVPSPDDVHGTTPETAIVLPDIADEFHGVAAEHTYIAGHFPTWHIEYQTRIAQNDRDYDVLGMIKPDRTKAAIYFDITGWVGK
jgi:hypothetical protein